jgi:hypothetical protein
MTVSTAAKKPGEKMDAVIESIDDASITGIVKAALLYHRSTSVLTTTVETTEGVVKLGGKAKNTAEKDLATKRVSTETNLFWFHIFFNGRTNHDNRGNLTRNSDTGTCGNNPNLAT